MHGKKKVYTTLHSSSRWLWQLEKIINKKKTKSEIHKYPPDLRIQFLLTESICFKYICWFSLIQMITCINYEFHEVISTSRLHSYRF